MRKVAIACLQAVLLLLGIGIACKQAVAQSSFNGPPTIDTFVSSIACVEIAGSRRPPSWGRSISLPEIAVSGSTAPASASRWSLRLSAGAA